MPAIGSLLGCGVVEITHFAALYAHLVEIFPIFADFLCDFSCGNNDIAYFDFGSMMDSGRCREGEVRIGAFKRLLHATRLLRNSLNECGYDDPQSAYILRQFEKVVRDDIKLIESLSFFMADYQSMVLFRHSPLSLRQAMLQEILTLHFCGLLSNSFSLPYWRAIL